MIFSWSYYARSENQELFQWKKKEGDQQRRGETKEKSTVNMRISLSQQHTLSSLCNQCVCVLFFSSYLVQTLSWQVKDGIKSRSGPLPHRSKRGLRLSVAAKRNTIGLWSWESLTEDVAVCCPIQTVSNWCKFAAVNHAVDGDDRVRGRMWCSRWSFPDKKR